ncbi:reverse transcriptase (RNA-dependent DNA polymerase) [Kutzneria buriramensis]|uniref:Reverse transcriptase (RNA-dependent DNA polymerase) n=1 Tax=Kutzneria buriramensis TaxID=1045776 RepID=A0A3E0HM89_9PSEU|nr:reverse transcriptase (RNA-dependent DNA polymerase) [Kutzneria buriramensis]
MIPKAEGGHRVLRVPTVRDRIVERAVLSQLRPHLDPVLGPSSYGFRPGLGVVDAVQALVRLREEGFGWVLRTDLHDCFPSVDLVRLRRLLEILIVDSDLLDLVDRLLARPAPGNSMLGPPMGWRRGRRGHRCGPTWFLRTSTTGSAPPASPWSATPTTSPCWPATSATRGRRRVSPPRQPRRSG